MRIRSFVLLTCLLFSSEVKAVDLSFCPFHYCFNLCSLIQEKPENFFLALYQTRFSLFRFPFFNRLLCVEPTIFSFSNLIREKEKVTEVPNHFSFVIKIKSELLKIFSGRVKGYFNLPIPLFTLNILFIKNWVEEEQSFGPWGCKPECFLNLKNGFDEYKSEHKGEYSIFLAFLYAIFRNISFSFEINIYSRLCFLFKINFLFIKRNIMSCYNDIKKIPNEKITSEQYELQKYNCIKQLIKNLLGGLFSFEINIFDGDLYSFLSE